MHQKDGDPASASIVAKEYFGNYSALRLNLTGRVDSASTTELIGTTVADTAGSGHRDQLTDWKSLLAIESRARGNIPLKYHQRVILSSKDRQTNPHDPLAQSHPEKRSDPWSENDYGVYMAPPGGRSCR